MWKANKTRFCIMIMRLLTHLTLPKTDQNWNNSTRNTSIFVKPRSSFIFINLVKRTNKGIIWGQVR